MAEIEELERINNTLEHILAELSTIEEVLREILDELASKS